MDKNRLETMIQTEYEQVMKEFYGGKHDHLTVKEFREMMDGRYELFLEECEAKCNKEIFETWRAHEESGKQ